MEEALTALLASVADGRRYWVRAPQGVPAPYVVMNRVSAIVDYHYKGASGLSSRRVQIDCYGSTYGEALAEARAVELLVSGYSSGAMQAIFVDSIRDLPAADAGDVNNQFRTSIDIIVHYQEN